MYKILVLLLVGFALLYLYFLYENKEIIKANRIEKLELAKQIAVSEVIEQARRHEELANKLYLYIKEIILRHAKTLAVKQEQMVYQDDYGNYFFDSWFKEIDYFIEHVLLNDDVAYDFLEGGDFDERQENLSKVKDIIFEVVEKATVKMAHEASDDYHDVDGMDGEQFERYCSLTLNRYGWNAKVTKASGDQGIDIIAQLDGMTAVFQCKRYSQPVGNSAVQEAIAGKHFAKAEIAAVVTNSTYTKSARQLANATNVYLLHHTDLERFSEKVFGE